MLTNDQIFERHPELKELREFESIDDIVEHYRRTGGELWKVCTDCGGPGFVATEPEKVVGVDICQIQNSPIYFYEHVNEKNESTLKSGYVDDLQRWSAAQGAFTTQEAAKCYFAAVEAAYKSDPQWQAMVEHERQTSEELSRAATEYFNGFLVGDEWEEADQ